MAIWQYSMYLSDPEENTGWSEQLAQDVGEGQPFFIASVADARRWAARRSGFLSNDAQVDGIVARKIGTRVTNPFWFDAPYKGRADEPNALAEVSIDWQLLTNAGQRREYWVRSVPHTWVNSGKITNEGQQANQSSIQAYFTWILNTTNTGVRTTNLPKVKADLIGNVAPVGNLVQPIQITVNKWPSGGVPVPLPGQGVRVTGLRGVPYVNGVWQVDQPTGTAGNPVTFFLYNSAKYQIGLQPKGGYVQLIQPAVNNFATANSQGAGRHKTGKIFHQQRGRGSAKVLHSR